jgi:hypothetical protein
LCHYIFGAPDVEEYLGAQEAELPLKEMILPRIGDRQTVLGVKLRFGKFTGVQFVASPII